MIYCRDIARGKEKVPIPVTNDVDDSNFPTDFTYVTESVWTSPVPINTMISSLSVSTPSPPQSLPYLEHFFQFCQQIELIYILFCEHFIALFEKHNNELEMVFLNLHINVSVWDAI